MVDDVKESTQNIDEDDTVGADAATGYVNGPILGRKIYGAVKGDSFFSGLVSGPRSIGKSSYCLKSLHAALIALGYSDAEAWELCLKSLKFKLVDVVDFLEVAATKDKRETCLIWDDCRISGSGSVWFTNPRLVQRLVAVLDTVRSSLCSMLLTAPSSDGLLGALKSYDDYIIKVSYAGIGKWYRCGKGYIMRSLPSGQKRVYRSFVDEFYCRLPNHIYARYNKMRKDALVDAIKMLKKEAKRSEE